MFARFRVLCLGRLWRRVACGSTFPPTLPTGLLMAI